MRLSRIRTFREPGIAAVVILTILGEAIAWIAILIGILGAAGCELQIGAELQIEAERRQDDCPFKTISPVDLPVAMRTSNWGGGSCFHAAACDLLRWQGKEKEERYWRSHYAGAAGVQNGVQIADHLDLDFAYTLDGDELFLDWCSRTRRGAVIYWPGRGNVPWNGRPNYDGPPARHAITFCGFVGSDAVVIDNNYTNLEQRIPRDEFLRKWRYSHGAAFTFVHTPAPKRPWI